MKLRRTSILTITCLLCLTGLVFARTGWLISSQLLLTIAIFWSATLLRKSGPRLVVGLLLAFCLGWWRGQTFLLNTQQIETLTQQKATVIVRATSDASYNERGQLEFEATNIQVLEPYNADVPGRMTAAGYGEPAVFSGDTVRLEGKFYKTRGSKQLGISFAQVKVKSRNSTIVDDIRRRFTAGIASSVPEPQASFGMGLLIGQRVNLPDTVLTQLSAVGLTHIIAVSGYNLTIIVRGVRRMLSNSSKYQSTALSFALIGIFLLMTGMSASIVRAAIVSGLSILAWYFGRSFKPLLLLSLAAVLTAYVNPFYVWSDIGWYLSFLAFFGVLIVAPLLHKRLFGLREPNAFFGLMLESLTAFVMTAPIIMHIFGQISLVALFANIIVVPMVPLAMVASVVAGLAGMFLPQVAGIFAYPATFTMTAMLDIVNLFSRIPGALKNVELTASAMYFFYGILLLTILILWKKTSKIVKVTE